MIYHLANNPTNPVQGWCFAGRERLGKYIGITRQAVYGIIDKLIEKGLVLKHETSHYLKTTELWYNRVVLYNIERKKSLHGVKKVYTECKESLHDECKESLHYNNILYKDSKKDSKYTAPASGAMEIIPDLLKDKQKHIRIIGLWARAKKIEWKNTDHQRSYIRRYVRPARDLCPYDINQIMQIMSYVIKNLKCKTTLETVLKYMDEDLQDLQSKANKIFDLDKI
jgi:hypothetical protein